MEEQIKFDVPDTSVFDDIRPRQRILSYKVKHIGEYDYKDYYYDTADLAIFNLGYSYRFRIRNKGNGIIEYGLQLKKEYNTKDSEDFKRYELDDVIPKDLGIRILAGEWEEAYSDTDLKTIKKLREFLSVNNIDYRKLAPCIIAEQKRSRFSMKRNGQLYFEISLDDCSFWPFDESNLNRVKFLQLEFENKFRVGIQREDEARILELVKFFEENYPVKIEKDSKYRKAILELLPKH